MEREERRHHEEGARRRARGGRTRAFREEQVMLHVARSSRKSTRAAALLSGVAAEDVYPASRSISYPTLLAHSQCAMSPFSPTRSKRERARDRKKPRTRKKKPGEQEQISGGYQLRSKTKGQTSREKKLLELETPACAPHSSLFPPFSR